MKTKVFPKYNKSKYRKKTKKKKIKKLRAYFKNQLESSKTSQNKYDLEFNYFIY